MHQRLYLVRHAHAVDDAPSDEARELSAKGHKQCARLIRGLAGNGLVVADTVWHSGLVRAFETADALAAGLELDAELKQVDGLAPYDEPIEVAAQLNELSQNCLVAGHEPNLSHLASLLLAGHSDFQRVVFPKASILALSRLKAGPQATPWQIEWHLSHAHFKK